MAQQNKVYSSTFGGEATKGTLYGGFYTLIAGAILGILALVLVVIGFAQAGDGRSIQVKWIKAAALVGGPSLPLFFLGVSTSLPSKRVLQRLAVLGLLICVGATAWFAFAYPDHFNVAETTQADYTILILSMYTVGLVLPIVSAFTSLIGYYLDRVAVGAGTGKRGEEGGVYDEYDVPDSVIEKDIEYAMRKYRYSWGEGESSATGVQINIKDDFEPGTVVGGKGVARTVQLEAPQVDDATKALKSIRPSKDTTVAASVTDDLTKSLLEFRKQKAAMGPGGTRARKLGWWARFLQWLGIRRAPTTPAASSNVPAHSQAPVLQKGHK